MSSRHDLTRWITCWALTLLASCSGTDRVDPSTPDASTREAAAPDSAPSPVAPELTDFSATPDVLAGDTDTVVTWSWSYITPPHPAPNCSLEPDIGPIAVGQQTTLSLDADATFTLTCTSSAGSDSASVTLTVSSWLAAVRAMPPNSWLVWPDSDFNTQAGAISITPGAGGRLSSVINAWSGGVLSDLHQRHYVWGGGHGDGSNNAWYYFDLVAGEWRLFKDRDHSEEIDTQRNPNQEKRYPNGNPVARHTRGSLTHDPATGTLYIGPAGSVWPGGHSDNGLYSLSMDGTYTLISANFMDGNLWGFGLGSSTVFLDDRLYVLSVDGSGMRRLIEWGVDGSGPIEHGKNLSMFNSGSELVGEYDPLGDLLVFRGSGTEALGDFTVYDFNESPTALATAHHPAMNGSADLTNDPNVGMSYSTRKQRWYLWGGSAFVYEAVVTSEEAAISKLEVSGQAPAPMSSQALYGNWRYWPTEDRFFGVNGAANDVVVYRPPL